MMKDIRHLHVKLTPAEEKKLDELANFYRDEYGIQSNKSAVLRQLISREHKKIFSEPAQKGN